MRQAIVALLLALAAARPARAATVTVRVTDEHGVRVSALALLLKGVGPRPTDGFWSPPIEIRATTDPSGVARFAGVAPGQYDVDLDESARLRSAQRHGQDTVFVRPQDNPLAPPPRLTVRDGDSAIEIPMTIHRGVLLHTRFVIDGNTRNPGATVHLLAIDTRFRTQLALPHDEERSRRLCAGRWEVELEPPEGYLLVNLEVNGRPVEGHAARLELVPGAADSHVSWFFVARAQVSGTISFRGPEVPVEVEARLLEPGPWLAAAEQRGGSRYARVTAGVDRRTGRYAMDLLDGGWQVVPTGQDLEALPPEARIGLAPGEQRVLDFTVSGPEQRRSGFGVRVVGPDGGTIDDAVVELWPEDAAVRGREPLDRARTPAWGRVYFDGIAGGSYLVAAAKRGYLEGREVLAYDPEAKRPPAPTVRLGRGAVIQVTVAGGGDLAADDARVSLERRDEGPDLVVADSATVAALRQPSVAVDTTGLATLRGVYPGRYRVTGSMRAGFIQFQDGEDWREATEVTVLGEETVELEARVAPAAVVAGSLFCAGGESLPPLVDLHLVPASAGRPRDPFDFSWRPEARLALDDTPLAGDQQNGFTAGPLEAGSYRLALRPKGFDRHTWAFGTEDGIEAGSFEVTTGSTTRLGAIGIDCAPAAAVRVVVASEHPAPDLRGIAPRFGNVEVSGTVRTRAGEETGVGRARIRAYESALLLHDLPEGTAQIALRIGHGYFLPTYWVEVPVQGTLERGRTLQATLRLPDVGGRVVVRAATAGTARLTDGAGAPRALSLEQGRALFQNLPAGTYRLDLCRDPACTVIRRSWSAIEVQRLATLELAE